jgi:type II secretory pathway pseudopilin PulG
MEMLAVVAIIVVLAGVGGYYLLGQVDVAKIKTCKVQVKELTKAAETYKLNNGQWPPSLVALTQMDPSGNPPALKNAEAIVTPYGQAYNYDPSGARNGGTQPDIWADTPKGPVGNWPG